MTHLLQLDASARPGLAGKDEHGSHSRHLTDRFVSRWRVPTRARQRDLPRHWAEPALLRQP